MTNAAQILPFPANRVATQAPRTRLLPPIPATTPDLSALIGTNTLVVADAENIMFSARDHGLMVDFRTLARRLSPQGAKTQLHAAYSPMLGDNRYARMFSKAGWQPHVRDIIQVNGPNGPTKRDNADTLFAAITGMLVAAYRPDSLILMTGDGCLVCDTVQAIRSLVPEPVRVSTLAVPGSVSSRLDPAINPLFRASVLMGQDLLFTPRYAFRPAHNRGSQPEAYATGQADQAGEEEHLLTGQAPNIRRQPGTVHLLKTHNCDHRQIQRPSSGAHFPQPEIVRNVSDRAFRLVTWLADILGRNSIP